jgi:hypothetical protein
MKKLNTVLKSLVIALIFALVGVGLVEYYPFIFSKEVSGEITGVERLMNPQMTVINGGQDLDKQVFSMAVAIKDFKTQEIFTASSEDRRWAVVQKGQCAIVRLFPYPIWNLEKSGTFFGAKLIKLYECPAK